MRARPLVLERRTEPIEPFDVLERGRLAAGAALAEIVGPLVFDELERELVAVLCKKAPCAELVGLADLEHVIANDPDDALPQRVGIAQPAQSLPGQLCADLLVAPLRVAGLRVVVQPAVGSAPGDVRLAEV